MMIGWLMFECDCLIGRYLRTRRGMYKWKKERNFQWPGHWCFGVVSPHLPLVQRASLQISQPVVWDRKSGVCRDSGGQNTHSYSCYSVDAQPAPIILFPHGIKYIEDLRIMYPKSGSYWLRRFLRSKHRHPNEIHFRVATTVRLLRGASLIFWLGNINKVKASFLYGLTP